MSHVRSRCPTLSSNKTLSGTTIAARPPGFRARTTCSRNASCLFGRVGRHRKVGACGSAAALLSVFADWSDTRSLRRVELAARLMSRTDQSAPGLAARRDLAGLEAR